VAGSFAGNTRFRIRGLVHVLDVMKLDFQCVLVFRSFGFRAGLIAGGEEGSIGGA